MLVSTTPKMTDRPAVLTIAEDGEMDGATRHYEKRWDELSGVYRDADAYRRLVAERGGSSLAYHVYEHRYHSDAGAIVAGTSIVLPAIVGQEYSMTRGHLHTVSDRAELYHCLSGHGVMLLDTRAGESLAVELRPGQAVNVPGEWVHRSVNVGAEPFVTLFSYAADAGQDYGLIERAGGMKTLIVRDSNGWRQSANPDHVGYRADITK